MRSGNNTFTGGGRLVSIGLFAFVVGLAGLAVGFVVRGREALFAYLAAYAWALSIALGALLFLMIVHAMDAKWPVAVRRIVEGITAVLPLLAVGVVPILLAIPMLYPWSIPPDAAAHGSERLLAHKMPYLNQPSFVVRAFVYFGIWLSVSHLLRRWSLRGDVNPSDTGKSRARVLSALALPPVALALTFAAVDWIMSLYPTWYSTIFGVYWFAGGFLGSFALIVLLLLGARREGLLSELGRAHYYALGRLMLAFTIFWAYIAYFQFFLIWMTNKPHEVSFYATRMHGPWGTASILLAVTHFAVPFLALLSYRIKQHGSTLAPIAGWLLVVHWFDMVWLIMPAVREGGPVISWIDVAALLCVGGACLAFGVVRQRGLSIVPRNDPALEAALHYESV
jgi:hypothetical protein